MFITLLSYYNNFTYCVDYRLIKKIKIEMWLLLETLETNVMDIHSCRMLCFYSHYTFERNTFCGKLKMYNFFKNNLS